MSARLATTFAAALVIAALGTSAAHAATYTVNTCATGAPSPWTAVRSGAHAEATDGCGSGGALIARLAPNATHQPGDHAGFTLRAPAGTTISAYALQRSVRIDTPFIALHAFRYALFEDEAVRDATHLRESCEGNHQCGGLGDPASASASSNHIDQRATGLHQLIAQVDCTTLLGPCFAGSTPAAELRIFTGTVTLDDPSAPTIVAAPTGSLVEAKAPLSGVASIALDANDVGSGVARGRLLVDDKVVAEAPASGGAATCHEPYAALVPCPNDATLAFDLDTASLSAGPHTAQIAVVDATGVNETRSAKVPFAVAGSPSQTGAGLPARKLPSLVKLESARPRATLAYGTATALVARVLLADGNPAVGARIAVLRRIAVPGGGFALMATLTAGQDGRIRFSAPGTVSATWRLASIDAPDRSASVKVVVRGGVSLRASRRRAHNGDQLSLHGRVSGRPYLGHGKVVEIQVAEGRDWRTVDAVRTVRDGSFSWQYRFRFTSRPTTYRFRALVRSEAGWPYATSMTRMLGVAVSP
jgi:hypothetical protein